MRTLGCLCEGPGQREASGGPTGRPAQGARGPPVRTPGPRAVSGAVAQQKVSSARNSDAGRGVGFPGYGRHNSCLLQVSNVFIEGVPPGIAHTLWWWRWVCTSAASQAPAAPEGDLSCAERRLAGERVTERTWSVLLLRCRSISSTASPGAARSGSPGCPPWPPPCTPPASPCPSPTA